MKSNPFNPFTKNHTESDMFDKIHNKKYNPLDGDRAAEHHDEVMGKHNRDRILDAYRLGAADKLSRLKNQNPYSKNKDKMRYIAYDNGYES